MNQDKANKLVADVTRVQGEAYRDGGDDMCKIMLSMMESLLKEGYTSIEVSAMKMLIARARKNNRNFNIEEYAQFVQSGVKPS